MTGVNEAFSPVMQHSVWRALSGTAVADYVSYQQSKSGID